MIIIIINVLCCSCDDIVVVIIFDDRYCTYTNYLYCVKVVRNYGWLR